MTIPKALPNDLIDGLLSNYKKREYLIGENGLINQLINALVECALQAEMSEHLGHDKHQPVANPSCNARNGKNRKKLKGEFGELSIQIHRDREGSFEPQLIPKHQTRSATLHCTYGVKQIYYVGWNKREQVTADLKRVYSAATESEPEQYLAEFEAHWDDAYPPIVLSWRNNWARITPFFNYPP